MPSSLVFLYYTNPLTACQDFFNQILGITMSGIKSMFINILCDGALQAFRQANDDIWSVAELFLWGKSCP